MKYLILIGLIFTWFSSSAYAQNIWPACISSASDPDGDGFGYENNSTCQVVSSSESQVTDNNVCIDDDNDGWGWNGIESCRVAPAATSDLVCVDTDPVGDGWGWNGVESCQTNTAASADTSGSTPTNTVMRSPASELDLIRSKFGVSENLFFPGFNRTGVAIYCAPYLNRPEELFFLLADGELKLLNGSGLWSSGWDERDNEMRFQWRRSSDLATIFSRVIVSDESVDVDRGRKCEWVQ